MPFKPLFAAAGLLFLALPAHAQSAHNAAGYAAGDAAAGKAVFGRCKSCHTIGQGARIRVGPPLNGIVGRPAGTWQGYHYSAAFAAKAKQVGTWDEEEIFTYLANPADFVDGRTKMTFRLKDAQDRRDVIAYIKQFALDGRKTP